MCLIKANKEIYYSLNEGILVLFPENDLHNV